jgi:L-serine/L-threonine ammonia-lyase
MCGVIEGLHNNGWEEVPVIAVETSGAASFSRSQNAGELITLDSIDSIATSLGAKTVSAQTLEWDRKHDIHSVIVTDKQAVSACMTFADDHRFLVEPACGASLATVYENHVFLKEMKSVVVIVCGGIGVDMRRLIEWDTMLP